MIAAVLALLAQFFTEPVIVVDVAAATVTVTHPQHPTVTAPVVVGKPGWETPTGRWEVTAVYHPDPSGQYGPVMFTLDAPGRADAGFDGIIALHGTNRPDLLDGRTRDRSHGCVRISNQLIAHLYGVYGIGVSTPVVITNNGERN